MPQHLETQLCIIEAKLDSIEDAGPDDAPPPAPAPAPLPDPAAPAAGGAAAAPPPLPGDEPPPVRPLEHPLHDARHFVCCGRAHVLGGGGAWRRCVVAVRGGGACTSG